MFKPTLKATFLLCTTAAMLATSYAQVAQEPLLTRSGSVQPNLVFVFDDSGSMKENYMYQYGTSWDGMGMDRPDSTYSPLSPDINTMYYDPRISYKLRLNADGTTMAKGSTSGVTSFKVYFYTDVMPYTSATAGNSASYANPYTPSASLVVAGNTASSYPRTVNSTNAPYPKFTNRIDCVASATSCSWSEELQNYANWKKYHSTRVELARTGIGVAFNAFGPTFRLGWGTINKLETTKKSVKDSSGATMTITTPGKLDAGVSSYNTTTKKAFYTWLYSSDTDPTGDTPNRAAIDTVGQYFSRSDSDGPWATVPNAASTSATTPTTIVNTSELPSSHASCRRSNVLLMTDGYWNGSSAGLTNVDNEAGVAIPPGPNALKPVVTYTYAPIAPYADVTSNTLADAAMAYWKKDLRLDLDNNVPRTIEDPAFWQHMSFYGIGLGVFGTLPQTTTNLALLTSGALSWPVATASDPKAIDDMWHAAVNTRGQFLNAGDANSLSDSIGNMMAQINRITSSQSGVAVSTANLIVGTRKYTPRYQTGSWTGNVIASELDSNSGNVVSTAWQVVGSISTGTTTITYSGIPAANSRNIVAWNGSNAEAFTNTTAITNSMTAPVTADLINYIRGDQSKEGSNGIYRLREARLGDIVNSAPAFVKGGVDLKYDTLPSVPTTGSNTYRSFYNSKKARTEGAVFVGANDGMLHAFSENSGNEVFAYIPRAVLPNLHLLANKNYVHRYFVDGPNVETDVYDGSIWKNLLLGTTGAGAKAVYALDVTSPVNMTTSSVLWEINSTSSSDFSELGHVLTDVQAGKTPSGNWVAIFGNGYDSTSGKARLFVVNLLTGAYIKHIDVGTSPGNGLGAVRIVRNTNKEIIGAYAGDLKGKMWKFDLTGTSSSSWQAGNNGSPIFDAGVTKPITASPAVIPNTTGAGGGGNVIAFATGKLFDNSDLNTTTTQSIYGVLDNIPFGSPTSSISTVGLSNLVEQTIGLAGTLTKTITNSDFTTSTKIISFYKVSQNTVTFSTTVNGWYINLTQTGQRNVYPVDNIVDNYISVDTISPKNVVTGDSCTQGEQGNGWLYLINGLTGGGTPEPILDTNGDGAINTSDALSNGVSTPADGRNIITTIESKSNESQTTVAIMGGAEDATQARIPRSNATTGGGSIKQREWRQLFMR